jgi:hypothetical protein
MRLPNVPRPVQRAAVLVVISAGWLSILGNSPGPTYSKKVGAKSGPVDIELMTSQYGGPCSFDARFSVGVRQVLLQRKSDGLLIGGISCKDGRDCLTYVHFPPSSDQCWMSASSQPTSRDAASDSGDGSSGDALADAHQDQDQDQDAGQTPADAGRASDPNPFLIDCTTDGQAPVNRRWIRPSSSSDSGACSDQGGTLQIVVETAAGTRSTLDYEVEVEQPDGYFGC